MASKKLLEVMANELTEQIVLTLDENAVVFVENKEGDFSLKRKYEEVYDRIYAILDSNLNRG